MKRLYLHILLWVLGLLVLAQVLIVGFVWSLEVFRGPKAALQKHVFRLARFVEREAEAAAKATQAAALGSRVADLGEQLGLRITWRDANDKVLARHGPELPAPKRPMPGTDSIDGARAYFRVVRSRANGDDGKLRPAAFIALRSGGSLALSPEDAEFTRHKAEVIAMFAALLVLVGVSLVPLSRRITRPLRELEQTARAIADGELTRRAPVRTKDEIAQLARSFNAMADRLGAALKQEKDLIAAVSHEVRAPLARLRLATELLADDPSTEGDARRHLATLTEEVGVLDQLIDELLLRARLGSEAFDLERAPVDLVELANSVAARVHTPDGAPRVTVDASGPAWVSGNRTLLARALRNLLENAVAYSPEGTPVRIVVASAGAEHELRVEDRGIGMTEAERLRVFEPFFRGEGARARRQGGVGFGLTLSRDIVLRHGGSLTLSSEPGAGTTVRMALPRIDAKPA